MGYQGREPPIPIYLKHYLYACIPLHFSTDNMCLPLFILTNNPFFNNSGDLVDRGTHGIEVWATVMRLVAENPAQPSPASPPSSSTSSSSSSSSYDASVASPPPPRVVVLRGNHEESMTWSRYSFTREIDRKFPGKQGKVGGHGGGHTSGHGGEDVHFSTLVKKMFTVFCERLPHAMFVKRAVDRDVERDVEREEQHEGVSDEITEGNQTRTGAGREAGTEAGREEKEGGNGEGKGEGSALLLPPPPPSSSSSIPPPPTTSTIKIKLITPARGTTVIIYA